MRRSLDISGSRVSQAEGEAGAVALSGRPVRLDRVSEGRLGRSEVRAGAGQGSKWDRTCRALWATHCNVCNQISVFLSLEQIVRKTWRVTAAWLDL